MAKENDYQLWVEQVEESGQVGIYIEDGSVAAIDGKPLKHEELPEPVCEESLKF